MPFGFGGSSSTTRSRSDSSSYDNLDQFGFNVGGSESQQRIAFGDIFQSLFGGAAGTAAGIDTTALSRNASMLFSSGTEFLDTLSSGGAGSAYLGEQLAGGGELVDEQIGQLKTDLTDFLNEGILPGITSSGVSASTLGGSRGEVAKGIAGKGLLREFARGSTDIRLADQARRDSIASELMGSEAARATTGLQMLPGLMGMAETSALAGLSPYAALASILGGPTVLGDSSSYQFGADSTTGRAASRSSSSSTTKSKSFSIGGLGG